MTVREILFGIIICFCSVAMYFVDFWFRFWYFQKLTTAKFKFRSNKFEISKF